MPAILLLLLYLFMALLPLGLSWAQGLPPRSVMDELASGAGLLALSVIMAEFLLIGRHRFVARRVGTDIVMRMHQLMARAAAILAIVHPFLYTGRRSPPPAWDTAHTYFVTSEFSAIWPGIVAWLLLPVLVLLAIGRNTMDVRYETWRLMHGLGSAAIAGFGVLHTLRAGRYSTDPVLAWVWIVLLGVVLFALANTYILRPLKQLRRPWKVTEVAPAGSRTWEVTLHPDGDFRQDYHAGQFAWLNIGHSPFSLQENPFSISSSPSAGPEVRFIIKELGDFTRTIGKVAPGTRAYLDMPHGHMTVAGHKAPGIGLIAGGVGIAPMMGILREMQATGDKRPATLIYGNRTEAQIAKTDELSAIASDTGAKIVHVLNDPPAGWNGETGVITPDLLHRHFGEAQHRDWLYILCGPPVMLEAVEDALIAMGIPSDRIISERFSYD